MRPIHAVTLIASVLIGGLVAFFYTADYTQAQPHHYEMPIPDIQGPRDGQHRA